LFEQLAGRVAGKPALICHAASAAPTIENRTVSLNAVRVSLPLVIVSGGQYSAQAIPKGQQTAFRAKA
jgi:hypothetical protein